MRLDFVPAGAEEAGLLLIQKDTAAFALTRARDAGGKTVLRLSRFHDGGRAVLAEQAVAPGAGLLRVVGDGLNYRFEHSANGRRWLPVGPLMDGTQLSPAVLKGFNYTGVFVGLYASSNGRPSPAHADFSRWRYDGRPECRTHQWPDGATRRGASAGHVAGPCWRGWP